MLWRCACLSSPRSANATLLTFSLTKLDGIQTQILDHVLARTRGAAHTVSHAWNLHRWVRNGRYSYSASDCSAAGQRCEPLVLLSRVSTVWCWWWPRHVTWRHVSAASRPLHPQPQSRAECDDPQSLSSSIYCTVILRLYSWLHFLI